jgi:hypothetical protein
MFRSFSIVNVSIMMGAAAILASIIIAVYTLHPSMDYYVYFVAGETNACFALIGLILSILSSVMKLEKAPLALKINIIGILVALPIANINKT